MAAIPLTEDAVRHVKRTLRDRFKTDSSAHLSEALAAGLGFATNISLMTAIHEGDPQDPPYTLLEEPRFFSRLEQLTKRPLDGGERSMLFDHLRYPDPSPVIKTRSLGWRRVKYHRSTRLRAWRNAMIVGINAGIEQRHFTVRAGDNRWPGYTSDLNAHSRTHVYEFQLGDIPARASVHDAGWDELAIHVALWPNKADPSWVKYPNAGFRAGDLFASGWLERRDGAWLQVPKNGLGHGFYCRRHRLSEIADLDIQPAGYADRGSFKL